MRLRVPSLLLFALAAPFFLHAQAPASPPVPAFALAGLVTSAEEGPMEGVMVGAKRTGGTVTITVVTDARGRYRFPRGRLEPGTHTLSIRAVGYDLDGASSVTITAAQDAAGNANQTATNNSFTVDTTGPTVALTYSKSTAAVGTGALVDRKSVV